MKILLLKKIICRRCGQIFHSCQHCWRGQAYCSDACQRAAQSESHRKSQQKYRQTQKGKERHRQAERRRRLRQNKKTMDDASSTPDIDHATVCPESIIYPPYCHFCGKTGSIVDHFPRRGYRGRYFDTFVASIPDKGGWYDTKKTAYQRPCPKN